MTTLSYFLWLLTCNLLYKETFLSRGPNRIGSDRAIKPHPEILNLVCVLWIGEEVMQFSSASHNIHQVSEVSMMQKE